MLSNLFPSRRRAEDARVARFVHAIALSGRYSVHPTWELQTVPDELETPAPAGTDWRTDTVALPTILLAGTIL